MPSDKWDICANLETSQKRLGGSSGTGGVLLLEGQRRPRPVEEIFVSHVLPVGFCVGSGITRFSRLMLSFVVQMQTNGLLDLLSNRFRWR